MKERELTVFGAEVKKRLIDKRMSQVELAKMVGTTKQYLNLILYGERSGEKYIGNIVKVLELDSMLAKIA